MPIICLAQDISDRLENPTSLKPLLKEVRNLGDSPKDSLQLTHLHIVWIEAALRNPNGLTPDAELAKDAQELELWTCEVILPPKGFAKQSLFDPSISIILT